jgi:hypothetical protein
MRFRERLYPSAGIWLALSLSFPMLLLAAMPFGLEVGIAVSVLGGLALLALSYFTSPVIEVAEAMRAGRFNVPLDVMGDVQELSKKELSDLLGVKSDARARMVLRAYVKSGVKIELTDPNDPTPYLIISSRRPRELAVALLANRT